jgi:predicted small lipoprotein YifL
VMSLRPRLSHLMLLAAAGTLVLALAGCGVKGALEPPPSSGIQDTPATAETPAGVGTSQTGPSATNMLGQPPGVSGVARGTTSAAVTQAPAAQQPSVLDWLVK